MKRNHLIAIMYGWITILFFVLLSSAVLALIVHLTNITEFTLSYITLIIGLLTLFLGGFVAGIKGKANGWIIGLTTGLGFTLITFFIQYLGFNEIFTTKQIIYHITYILCAIIGSIIGVNLFTTQENSS